MICADCGVAAECRPYGSGGSWVCFKCGMKDEATARMNFDASMRRAEARSASGAVVLTEQGLAPLDALPHGPQAAES